MIRQVLQHLSNTQIAAILAKLRAADLIVTEHVPTAPGVVRNKDKAAGPDIRLYRKSGVFLESPPDESHKGPTTSRVKVLIIGNYETLAPQSMQGSAALLRRLVLANRPHR